MDGTISPPPLKRRKRNQETATSVVPCIPACSGLVPPAAGTLRIFSWNINGIEPFVQSYLQRSIKSFLQPSSTNRSATDKSRRKRCIGDVTTESDDDQAGGSGDVDGEEDSSKEDIASLRLVLRRYSWPHVLFLQEIKIKPGDNRTMNAVRKAVNDPSETTTRQQNKGSGNVNSTKIIGALSNKLTDGGPVYDVHFNLPADPYNAKGFGGKVYGAATIIRKDFQIENVKQVRDVPWDREGRIQIIETKEIALPLGLDDAPDHDAAGEDYDRTIQNTLKFAIINIYAVNGTSNPYRSTHTGIEMGTRHDRKLAVHTELLREAHALEAQGFQVIISGDLNIARAEIDGHPNLRVRPHQHVLNRLDFNNKFFTSNPIRATPSKAAYSNKLEQYIIPGFNGIDTFRHIHELTPKFSYHPRGVSWGTSCDRVDLIIASRSLSKHIANAGICDSPRDRGPSDHCPIWVEIGRTPTK